MKNCMIRVIFLIGIFVSSLIFGISLVEAQTETPDAGADFGTGSVDTTLEALSPSPALANICVYDKWWCVFYVNDWAYANKTLIFPVVISDPDVVGVNYGKNDEPTATIDVSVTVNDSGYGESDIFWFTGLNTGYAVMTACDKEYGLCLSNPRVYDFSVNQLIGLTIAEGDAIMDDNPDWAGGGKRIFPGEQFPGDTADRKTVKILVESTQPNATVYFKSFDMDDAAEDFPDDLNGAGPAGNDNRGTPKNGTLSAASVQTDDSGFAEVEFTVTMHPGDNFMVAASCNEQQINGVKVDGYILADVDGQKLPTNNVKVIPMITVWRLLHMEVDSMGAVSGNEVKGKVRKITTSENKNQSTVYVDTTLENNRFHNGNLEIEAVDFPVKRNSKSALIVEGIVEASPQVAFTLRDDDDYDEDSYSDEGSDIMELPKTFSLMKDSIKRDENIFSAAFIQPKYDGGGDSNYNNDSISFALNSSTTTTGARNQMNLGLNSYYESDAFWVAYVQLAYQPETKFDIDPDSERIARGGFTIVTARPVDDVTNAAGVPEGGWGSLLFLETMRDYHHKTNIDFRIKSAPHEVGHQFGLKGDDKKNQFGIMSSNGPNEFVPRHLNVLRWRVKSPGN